MTVNEYYGKAGAPAPTPNPIRVPNAALLLRAAGMIREMASALQAVDEYGDFTTEIRGARNLATKLERAAK